MLYQITKATTQRQQLQVDINIFTLFALLTELIYFPSPHFLNNEQNQEFLEIYNLRMNTVL